MTVTSAKERTGGLVWVAAGASLWGTDTVLRQPLTAHWNSAQIVLGEHLILTAVLAPVLWISRSEWRKLGPLEWAAVLGVAWGGSALGTVCFTKAIAMGNPTTAVLLQKTQPLAAVLLARVLLGEALGRRFWMYLAAAIFAAWVVSFGLEIPGGAAAARMAPALLAVSAAALWGSLTVLSRFALGRLSFHALTALRIIVATPLLVGLAWFNWGPAGAFPEPRELLSLALLALVPGLVALLIYYRGLSGTTASRAAVAELSFPAVAAILNRVFLGATLSIAQLAGFALLWGVILKLKGSDHA